MKTLPSIKSLPLGTKDEQKDLIVDFEQPDFIIKDQPQQNNFLDVQPEIFDTMKCSNGKSISEINKQGYQVLLFFPSYIGSINCKGTLYDIIEFQEEMLKMNCIPIVAHGEDNLTYEKYINSSINTQIFSSILHMERKSFVKHFKLQHSNLVYETYWVMKKGISESQRLNKLGYKTDLSSLTKKTLVSILSAVFIIENQKIISEKRKEYQYQRFDLARILIDANGCGSDSRKSLFESDFLMQIKKTKKKKTQKKGRTTISSSLPENSNKLPSMETNKRFSLNPLDFMSSKSENLQYLTPNRKSLKILNEGGITELEYVLKDERSLKYFKIYASREYSVENIILFEEIQIYKTLVENKRKIRSKQMMEIFFQKDSIHEINTSNRFIKVLERRIKEEDFSIDLFDIVLIDVIQNNLMDTFSRFQISELHEEMKRKTQKKYFLF